MQGHPLSNQGARTSGSGGSRPLSTRAFAGVGTDVGAAASNGRPTEDSAGPFTKTSETGFQLDRRNPFPADPDTAQRLLVIESNPTLRAACGAVAAELGFAVRVAESGTLAQDILQHQQIDLLLLDLELPDRSASTLLEEVRSQRPDTVIVVIATESTSASALEAMRLGATDYLIKPFSMEEFTTVLERSAQPRSFDVQSRALRERLSTGSGMGTLVGRSPAMDKLYRILSKVAFTAHPVLILGESGTGKELVARSIHANGPNAARPFIPVDCSALVPTLIESELFGHVKGAFTGAATARTGLLAAAENGTVFLDEVGELPLDLQAKLLRALQEKEVRPVGATQPVPISARVLAATNRDLAAMVAGGRFRKDLFYRLNVVNMRIPALRDRRGDIPLLADHILARIRRESGLPYSLGEDAMRLLTEYDWPGNVRELEHALERAAALSSGPVLHAADLPTQMHNQFFSPESLPEQRPHGNGNGATVTSIAEMEREAILRTIQQLNGDKLKAAKLLGIGKTTLYRKLKEYGLEEQGDDAQGQHG